MYARLLENLGGIILYFYIKGRIVYIKKIHQDGAVDISAHVEAFKIKKAGSKISILVDEEYLSARKNGRISFRPLDLDWERLEFRKVDEGA